jgi:hypothetical protein
MNNRRHSPLSPGNQLWRGGLWKTGQHERLARQVSFIVGRGQAGKLRVGEASTKDKKSWADFLLDWVFIVE